MLIYSHGQRERERPKDILTVSQVVRQGTLTPSFVCSIQTLSAKTGANRHNNIAIRHFVKVNIGTPDVKQV